MEWYSWVFAGLAAIFFVLDLYLTKQLKNAAKKLAELQEEIKLSELRIQDLQYHIRELRTNI